MNIKYNLVSKSNYNFKCPYPMTPKYITIHNTANDASAFNEVKYMIGNTKKVSFHFAVDDIEVVQGIPLDRNTWHAGDGMGAGNMHSISIEICYSKSGGEKFKKAYKNTIELVVMLMRNYNIPLANIKYHNSWTTKYCPHRLLDMGVTLEKFKQDVRLAYWSKPEGGEDVADYTGHWAEPAIKNAIEKKIMVGSGKGRFRPNDSMTRAEMAQVIDNLLKYLGK